GQAAGHRRNRRRSARGGRRHRVCEVWSSMRGLHGRRGHGPSGDERLQDALAGGNRSPGPERQPDIERCDERGDPGLGHQRPGDALRDRLGGRPPSVSSDGSRVSIRDRPRGKGADAQVVATHSVSAGLDYPGVGPEHAYLHDTHRADYVSVTDQEALDAFHQTSRLEGIIPALESSHALAYTMQLAGKLPAEELVLVNLSGRGDKDLDIVRASSE